MMVNGSLPMSHALRMRFNFSGLSGAVKSDSLLRKRFSSFNKSLKSCGGPPRKSCTKDAKIHEYKTHTRHIIVRVLFESVD